MRWALSICCLVEESLRDKFTITLNYLSHNKTVAHAPLVDSAVLANSVASVPTCHVGAAYEHTAEKHPHC